MKKILKWTAIVLVSIVALVGIIVFGLVFSTNARLSKTYTIPAETIAIPTDSATLAFGERYVTSVCAECHGPRLNGKLFFNEPGLGKIITPNLTKGAGGLPAYTTEDWVRALRHGVNKEGRALFIMPSDNYGNLSEADLGAIIAYLQSFPPVDSEEQAVTELTLMARILLALGAFGDKVIPAEIIDHERPLQSAPAADLTAEYGKYLVSISGCTTCHGPQLNGAKDPNPKAPIAPNITSGGNFGHWGQEHFINTMRTGVTPEGKALQNEFMPWNAFKEMTDDELTAIYLYLNSLDALEDAVVSK